MKNHIKLYEDFHSDSQFFKTRKEVESWMNIQKTTSQTNPFTYTINDDLTVDVYGAIAIKSEGLIPVQFRKVSGVFYCNHNKLTSLKGCPEYVGGDFHCHNNYLTSLEYCPREIKGRSFSCYENELTSLVFAPREPSSYGDNPCAKYYNIPGFNINSHIQSMLALDPNPADTIQRLKKYNPVLAKELSLEFGLESAELTDAYNTSKNVEGDFY